MAGEGINKLGERFKLTRETLNDITKRIESKNNTKIYTIEETVNGYAFIGKYDLIVAEIIYDYERNCYKTPLIYSDVILQIRKRDEIKDRGLNPRHKRFNLYQNNIGEEITVTGLKILSRLGAIKASKIPPIETEVKITRNHMNNIISVNDILLLSWAKFVMDSLKNIQFDDMGITYDDIYGTQFAPIIIDYYNYLDYIDSGLSKENINEVLSKKHDSFRSKAFAFDEYLKNSKYSKFAFLNTYFANAIVVDKKEQLLVPYGRFNGEVVNSNDELVTFDDEFKIYILASDIPGNNYNLNNLPIDVKLFSGNAYLSEDHFNDFR